MFLELNRVIHKKIQNFMPKMSNPFPLFSYSRRTQATDDWQLAIESDNTEDIKKFSKRSVKVTKQHNDDCKRLLQLMGVTVLEAPSVVEAQCAALCRSGKVYAMASKDMDTLTFGAPIFLRHLMDPSSRKVPVMEFEVAKVLEELNLNMDQFIDLCILSGCKSLAKGVCFGG